MSLPRPVYPGTTYLITRRCAQRAFLLRPSEEVNQIFLYCLAIAAAKFQIEIHAFCAMSNHYHIVATDTLGQLPAFMHWLNRCVAKCLNAILLRSDAVWSQGSYSAVRLEMAEDVLDKMIYVFANPVKSGLVRDSQEWPGAISFPEDLDGRVLSASRPAAFFRKTGDLPMSATIKLVAPPTLAHLSSIELIFRLRKGLNTRQQSLREDVSREKRSFLGRRAVLGQSPFAVPVGPDRNTGINPRVACKNKARRLEILASLQEFYRSYRESWKTFCKGVRDVIFPRGTYLLRVRYNVPCEPSS